MTTDTSGCMVLNAGLRFLQRKVFCAMQRIQILSLGFALTVSVALADDGNSRPVKEAVHQAGALMAVAAEGDFEPRSIGSYSLRIYNRINPDFPYDNFTAGTVRPRDGSVEDVSFSDLDNDGALEIVVVIRSAGTGAYLAGDAFQLNGARLTFLESVSNLAPDADPVRALKAKLTKYPFKTNDSPDAAKQRQ